MIRQGSGVRTTSRAPTKLQRPTRQKRDQRRHKCRDIDRCPASDLRPLTINTFATRAHIDLDHPLIPNGERRPDVPSSTPVQRRRQREPAGEKQQHECCHVSPANSVCLSNGPIQRKRWSRWHGKYYFFFFFLLRRSSRRSRRFAPATLTAEPGLPTRASASVTVRIAPGIARPDAMANPKRPNTPRRETRSDLIFSRIISSCLHGDFD